MSISGITQRLNKSRQAFAQAIAVRMKNRRFWQAGGLLMLANIIVTALGLVRTPVITWVIPKEEVGMLGVVAAWLPFLQLLSLPGLDNAIYHFAAKGYPLAFLSGVFQRLRWSTLASIAFLAVALYWFRQGNEALAWMFVITGLSFPLTSGLTAAGGMLGAQENFTGLFWYRLGESLTDFTGFIPLALSLWAVNKMVTFYASNQIATAVMMVLVSVWLARHISRKGSLQRDPGQEREMVQYGKHLSAISAISVVQARADALVVSLFTPLGTVADYSIATILQEQLKKLWGIYVTIRYPPLVRMDPYRRRRRTVTEGLIMVAGMSALALVVSIAAHLFIPVVLPSSYTSSLPYIDLLFITLIAGMPGGIVETYFRMEQDQGQQYVMRIVAGIFGLALPLLLVFRWGAYGAALGRMGANLIFSVLGIGLFIRYHKSTA